MTICALSTPSGGALGIIRISGPDAITITDKVFRSKGGKPLSVLPPYSIHYGTIITPSSKDEKEEEVVDEVITSIFRAPHSYTGEDMVEISCHGSSFILSQVLQLLIDNGCRQALPGEFTKRAFLNGKMDLSQAEAVADLIASRNKASHDIALSQLRGNFSNELAVLRENLLKITSLLELELDFSEEDVNFADRAQLLKLAEKIRQRITTLLDSFRTGKAIKEGIPVAIVGKTNVGKSTLLNRLLHEDKAIVSNIHGTTRDAIEDTTNINGITFRFIDTAGLRQTTDEVENIGIERTHQKIKEAQIILYVTDKPLTEGDLEDTSILPELSDNQSLLIIQNKSDLNPQRSTLAPPPYEGGARGESFPPHSTLSISAKYDKDLTALEQAIFKAANIPEISENDVIITNTRHIEALSRALTDIDLVIDGLQNNLSGDLIAEHLRAVLQSLGEITGQAITSTEVLSSIFSHFCIGK